MENKLLVLNHKMNLNVLELNDYIKHLNSLDVNNLVICPSALYLPYFVKNKYGVGIQNIYIADNGSYTGEISSKQAMSLGVNYALIGHSERRVIFKENDQLINKKVLSALNALLIPILCVGEVKKGFGSNSYILRQISKALENVVDISKVIIAYEPVWAIGTSRTPTNDEINDKVKQIKIFLNKKYQKQCKVLYGGSVNENNIGQLNLIESIDGFLVGGASLDITKVDKMIKVILQR